MASALKKFGEAALKARFVNGHWHKPKVSARKAADLKKEAAASGECVPLPCLALDWDYLGSLTSSAHISCNDQPEYTWVCREWPYPEEDSGKPDRPFGQYKRLKGHKHEREKAARWHCCCHQ